MPLYSLKLFEGGPITLDHVATTIEAFLSTLTETGFVVGDRVLSGGGRERYGVAARNVAAVAEKKADTKSRSARSVQQESGWNAYKGRRT